MAPYMARASTACSSGKSKVRPDRMSAPVARNSVVCMRSAETMVAAVKLMTSTSIAFSRRM